MQIQFANWRQQRQKGGKKGFEHLNCPAIDIFNSIFRFVTHSKYTLSSFLDNVDILSILST